MKPIIVGSEDMLARLTQTWNQASGREQNFALGRLGDSLPKAGQRIAPGSFSNLVRPLFNIRTAEEVKADLPRPLKQCLSFRLDLTLSN